MVTPNEYSNFDTDLKEGEVRVTVERYGDRRRGLKASGQPDSFWPDIVEMILKTPISPPVD